MLRKALNIPFGLHISNEDLYADLPYVSHIIRHRRLGLAGHLARTDQVDTSDRLAGTKPAQPGRYVLTWHAPGRARQGRHPWTFRDRLGMDMCSYTHRSRMIYLVPDPKGLHHSPERRTFADDCRCQLAMH
eukprot:jgi/Mesvir1/2063/Mv26085-RA.1